MSCISPYSDVSWMRRLLMLLGVGCLLLSRSADAADRLLEYNVGKAPDYLVTVTLAAPVSKWLVGETYHLQLPNGSDVSGKLTKMKDVGLVLAFDDGLGSLRYDYDEEGQPVLLLFSSVDCESYVIRLHGEVVGILASGGPHQAFCDRVWKGVISPEDEPADEEAPPVDEFGDWVFGPSPFAEPDVRKLQSKSNAEATIYLDFWGSARDVRPYMVPVQNTHWNMAHNSGLPIYYPPYDYDGDPNSLTEEEEKWIRKAWKIVAEDYAPFAVNVTTDRSVYESTPLSRRARNIITEHQSWADEDWGGVAVMGWGNPYTSDSWTFSRMPEDPWGLVDPYELQFELGSTISHEVGHTLGLTHFRDPDDPADEYFSGTNMWAPIMGGGRFEPYRQWASKPMFVWEKEVPVFNVHNPNASITIIATQAAQDEMDIISSELDPVADDVGNDRASATVLTPWTVNRRGLITPANIFNDTDFFEFSVTERSKLDLHVRSAAVDSDEDAVGANLAMNSKLVSESGEVLAEISVHDEGYLSPRRNRLQLEDRVLEPGRYFLDIRAETAIDIRQPGFTEYGNGGEYLIDFNLTPVVPPSIVQPLANEVLAGSTARFEWTDNGSPIDEWRVVVGSTPGSDGWFDSGVMDVRRHFVTLANIPIDGERVYLTFLYRYKDMPVGQWESMTIPVMAPVLQPPAFTTPPPNSALSATEVTFNWDPNDFDGASSYQLLIGTAPGLDDIHSGPFTIRTYQTADLSAALPGQTLFATLRFRDRNGNGNFSSTAAVFQADGGAVLFGPAISGDGGNPVYRWMPVPGARSYQIRITPTAPGSSPIVQQRSPGTLGTGCKSGVDVTGCRVRFDNIPITGPTTVEVRAYIASVGWTGWSLAREFRP